MVIHHVDFLVTLKIIQKNFLKKKKESKYRLRSNHILVALGNSGSYSLMIAEQQNTSTPAISHWEPWILLKPFGQALYQYSFSN